MKSYTYHDVYEKITAEVIEHLEKGDIIWRCKWNNKTGAPQNPLTSTTYNGWNAIWLTFVTAIRRYSTPFFLTYMQAKAAGGNIKKDARGHTIIYAKTQQSKKRTIQKTNKETGEKTEVPATDHVWRTHTVFNLDQTENIPFPAMDTTPANVAEKILSCEKIIAEMPNSPTIIHMANDPLYDRISDTVVLPPLESFEENTEYYVTAFHELAHATGHPTRLNRDTLTESTNHKSYQYSKEELVAEFTATFLCGICEIEKPILENSAAYIKGWLSALKNDKKLLISAASQAQKAADFILNKQQVQQAVATEEGD